MQPIEFQVCVLAFVSPKLSIGPQTPPEMNRFEWILNEWERGYEQGRNFFENW